MTVADRASPRGGKSSSGRVSWASARASVELRNGVPPQLVIVNVTVTLVAAKAL